MHHTSRFASQKIFNSPRLVTAACVPAEHCAVRHGLAGGALSDGARRPRFLSFYSFSDGSID